MSTTTNDRTMAGHLAAGTRPGARIARTAPREVVSMTAFKTMSVALIQLALAEREHGRTIRLGSSPLRAR